MPLGISVMSGKGGTGKTLIALNLAFELARRGVKVALLDADISNANLLTLANYDGESTSVTFTTDHRIVPATITFDNIQLEVCSVEMLAGSRGVAKPGEQSAAMIQELIKYTAWKSDYIIVDAPAGYYDIHKSVIASFDSSYLGTLIVTQPAHSKDLIRVLDLHSLNEIPVIGCIENMSSFICDNCKTEHFIYGASSTEEIASNYGIEFFGSIPLMMGVREMLNAGKPAIIDEEYRAPIVRAADAALKAKPRKPGFLEKAIESITDSLKNSLMKAAVEVLVLAKRTVPIADIQRQFNFPGGRVIHLRLTDRSLERPVVDLFLTLKDGALKVLDKTAEPDVTIVMYYKALIWAILKRRPTERGYEYYDFLTAYLNDEARVYGKRESWENMRAWYVLQVVLERLRQYQPAQLESILGVLA
ncbi:MAG: P-loop NTPase [Thaumarchaeota archaeon]|nr:P-loop NTPase [Candidatus Calditenuaceae archaeon]